MKDKKEVKVFRRMKMFDYDYSLCEEDNVIKKRNKREDYKEFVEQYKEYVEGWD